MNANAIIYLVGIAGQARGGLWRVPKQGIVVGRDAHCDVVLDDSVVSRRQCTVAFDGERISLRDLGSRNSTLVNGQVVRESALNPGDEIAVGQHRLIVTKSEDTNHAALKSSAPTPTRSWAKGEPYAVDMGAVKPGEDPRPGTIQDLALLYEVSRELGSAPGLKTLENVLKTRLRERFKPVRGWFCLASEDAQIRPESLLAFDDDNPCDIDPDILARAWRERQGLLIAQKQHLEGVNAPVFTLAAPLLMGDVSFGGIVLQTRVPHGAYDEEDLKFLVLLCRAAAPMVYAVGNLEELRRDNEWLRYRHGESFDLIGESRAIRHVRAQVARAAKSSLSALITGETGTGKEIVARRIHALSARRAGPLVVVNCAAIPRDLFESQLFGYEKGAYTGAQDSFEGLLAQADKGTLFLDEVGDLSLDNQARVLRAIELGTFRRIGAKEETRVDIRVIAATNKDIAAAVEGESFRKDLYHRLNGFEIFISPLRERPSDIPTLARHFFDLFKHSAKRPLSGIAPGAMEYLCSYSWPGNVRELRNRIQRAVTTARQNEIQVNDVRDMALTHNGAETAKQPLSLAEVEKGHILETLRWTGGNVHQAAKILQIGRTTLYTKMAEYGIQ